MSTEYQDDPFTAPPQWPFGTCPFTVAPHAGRSEAVISCHVPGVPVLPEILVEVYVRIYTNTTDRFTVAVPLADLSGIATITTSYSDLRYPPSTTGAVFVGARLVGAATAAITLGGELSGSSSTGLEVRMGPYYLDPSQPSTKSLLARPTKDNVGISGMFEYRILKLKRSRWWLWAGRRSFR